MSCDAYSDLWDNFFFLKSKYWPDCPYNTYLVANRKTYNKYGVKTVLCGEELNWIGRLRKCLCCIEEENVILMLEDYYISNYVSQSEIDSLFEILSNYKFDYCKLETRGTVFNTKFKSNNYLRCITPDIKYGVSLVTSIWKKEFLLKVIGESDYSAWEFEIKRNQSDDITKQNGFVCLCDVRNVLNIIHMVQRGKYINKSYKQIKKTGVVVDLKNRKKLSFLFDWYLWLNVFLKRHSKTKNAAEVLRKRVGVKSISEKYEEETSKKIYK